MVLFWGVCVLGSSQEVLYHTVSKSQMFVQYLSQAMVDISGIWDCLGYSTVWDQ